MIDGQSRIREMFGRKLCSLQSKLIIVLITISITTRISLIIVAPYIYHLDSFNYLNAANNFALSGEIQFRIGLPFILFLGTFLRAFLEFSNIFLASRICVLLTSTLLVILTYLLGNRLSGNLLGLVAGLFVIFNPYILKYSVVPHNDIFALTVGVLAFLFSTSRLKKNYLLSAFFIYLALLTRPDIGLALLFPIVTLCYTCISSLSTKKRIIIITLLYILPSFLAYLLARSQLYMSRFNLLARFLMFFQLSKFRIVLDRLFTFSEISILNTVSILFIGCGLLLAVLEILSLFIRFTSKDKGTMNLLSAKQLVAFNLFLFFLIYLVVVVVWGFPYTIEDGVLQVHLTLNDRRLIPLSFVLSYAFAYPIARAPAIMTKYRLEFSRNLMKPRICGFLILIILTSSQLLSMGIYASKISIDASTARESIVKAANWLSIALGPNETALVPTVVVFSLIEPELHGRLLSYKSLWDSAGIVLKADTTEDEVLEVRSYLLEFLKSESRVRYMVRDWVDPYVNRIFGITANDELMSLIKKSKVIRFTLSTGWSSQVTIYECGYP